MNDEKSPPNPEFSERERPTQPDNPLPAAVDGYDTSFIQGDSTFSRAVEIVAKAGRAINAEREERRSHEEEERAIKSATKLQLEAVLLAIQNADKNNTANYQMLASELKLLKQSDVNQDREIAQLKMLPGTMEERITNFRQEILAQLPEMLQAALKPFIDRLEALEKAESRRQAATA